MATEEIEERDAKWEEPIMGARGAVSTCSVLSPGYLDDLALS